MGAGLKLIADSGSTKTEWGLLGDGEPAILKTQGVSPFFQSADQIRAILEKELVPQLPAGSQVAEVYFYGTGLSQLKNLQLVSDAIKAVWPGAVYDVQHDLMGAARLDLVATPVSLNGAAGAQLDLDAALDTVVSVVIEDGRIRRIYAIRNPSKLTHLDGIAALSRG